MDGRESFVFSWNKNHRVIHEEALLHFFDPSKKGQWFDYQTKAKQLEAPFQKREGVGSSTSSSAEQRREDFSVGRSRSADEIRDDLPFGSTTGNAMATYDNEHGVECKETPSASTGRTKVTGKGRRGI